MPWKRSLNPIAKFAGTRAVAVVLLQLLVAVYVPAEEGSGTEQANWTTGQKLAKQYGWPYVAGHKGLSRQEIVFPQVRGLQVIKADLHIHTIYSDGQVLPESRVWEAWGDGLDLMVITDHPEYLKLAFPRTGNERTVGPFHWPGLWVCCWFADPS